MKIDKTEILIQKEVNLVQSAHFKPTINKQTEIKSITDIISLNYMGYAEFAFDALPNSFKRIVLNQDFYKIFIFSEYQDKNGNPLKVYAPEISLINVKNIVERLTKSGYRLKSYCTLNDYLKNNRAELKDNFWWDIENDFFIFFENTDKILCMIEYLRKNFDNIKNKKSKKLKKIYLQRLTKSITTKHYQKSYHYNKKKKTHYLEYFGEIEVENVLMEGIILSNLDEKKVNVIINGKSLFIDSKEIVGDSRIIDINTYLNLINDKNNHPQEKILANIKHKRRL